MPIIPADDGHVIPEVGPWCRRKYHFLQRYLNAFTVAMKDKWKELHYIDLFAGAAFARIRGTSELVAGSPVIAANSTHPFTQLHLCDVDPANVAALRARLAPATNPRSAHIVAGDANAKVAELLRAIPRRGCLCVTFADPFGLHLDYETVRVLAQRRSDLIILLADTMDAVRNWAAYYFERPNSSLDRFMGEGGWRDEFLRSPTDQLARRVRERYQQQLGKLGYQHFAFERIRNQQDRDIYVLFYASRAKVGAEIWNRTSQIDEIGQRSFDFGA